MTALTLRPHDDAPPHFAVLHEGARQRMARALGLGTTGILVLFLALIPVLSHVAPPLPAVLPDRPPVDLGPIYRFPPPPASKERSIPVTPSKNGTVLPVDHEAAPPQDTKDPGPSRDSDAGVEPGTGPIADDAHEDARAEDALPGLGTWVDRDEEPVLVRTIDPEYPELAKIAGVQGTVYVHALVGRDGRVVDARIARSVVMLDEAALDAVRHFIFKPAFAAGRPVPVWVAVPIKFRLY